ncbi:MAG: prolipoprotein diacylglyceryl transferase [Planctomycetota bacterium]|nr:prolipoprotein diacylglyceryl transferase [Planctomycetota bacterium]
MAGGHWVHDLDPFVWRISGDFGIRWYGVSYLVGIVLGWWLLRRWARQGRLPMASAEVGDFAMTVALGMIAGGRLGYAAFYEPALFVTWSDGFPWWKLLALHEGGMASHGGMIGIALAAWWWSWRRRQHPLVLGDALAAVGPLGIACGRIANFINGELWGRPWDGPWAVIFPHADPPVPRHPSQLYAAVLEGLLIAAILLPLHARHRRPGLTLGGFAVLYGLGRFIGEFFREPDRGQPGFGDIPPLLGFMSKGQALTLPLFAIGLWLIWRAWRRPPQPAAYAPLSAMEPPAAPAGPAPR